MCACVNVLPRGRASVSVYAFDHVWLVVCTCVSAYVCFPAHVLTSGCVCLCVLLVQVPVCMFMRAHVCCPLMDYLYPRCDICSRLSRRVQAGPRVFFLFFFSLGILSVQTWEVQLEQERVLLISCWSCSWLSRETLSTILSSTASGRDWTSWVITAHPPSWACYPRNIHSLNTHKKNAYWITPSRSAALFLLFFSGMHLGFVGSAFSISLFSKPELLMQTHKTVMIFFLGNSRLIRLQCPSNDTHICI